MDRSPALNSPHASHQYWSLPEMTALSRYGRSLSDQQHSLTTYSRSLQMSTLGVFTRFKIFTDFTMGVNLYFLVKS